MKSIPYSTEAPPKITVRGVHCELAEDVRSSALERASRLAEEDNRIDHISIELERDPNSEADLGFVAKAHVEFGGPALLTSVTDRDPARAIDYLFDKIRSQLRRQRASIGSGVARK